MSDNDLSEITSKVAVNIITELFKTCAKGAKQASIWLGEKNKTLDPLGVAAKKYSHNLEIRYNVMRVFGMTEPRPLRNIFVKVNILEKPSFHLRKSISTLREMFFENQRSLIKTIDTKEGIEAANDKSKLIVLGKPGSGKTTFLKFLLLQCLDGKLQHKLIPIFVSLKDWSESEESLESFITREFQLCGIEEPLSFVQRILSNGKCLVLLDGFDEVAYDKLEEAISEIKSITTKFRKNRFVLSCRTAIENFYIFEHFTEVEIADFDEEQIYSFVFNWFGEGSKKAQDFFSKISQKSNLPVKELSSNPLLLTLLCITFDEILDFPNNRAELYKESIDALLRKWDSSRSIKRHDPYNLLSLRRKESLLAHLALKHFQANQYFIAKRTLENDIAGFIKNLPNVDEKHLEISSENVLKTIESQHGILAERSYGVYSFSHLTFQEYFAAKTIADNSDLLKNLVSQYIFDPRWREVFLLVPGLMDDASMYFIEVRKALNTFYVGEEEISNILDRLSLMIDEDREPHISRVLTLFYISNFRRLDEYTNILLPMAIDITVARNPNLETSHDFDLDFALKMARKENILVESNDDINSKLDRKINQQINLKKIKSDNGFSKLLKKNQDTFVEYLKATRFLIELLDVECYMRKELRFSLIRSLFDESKDSWNSIMSITNDKLNEQTEL